MTTDPRWRRSSRCESGNCVAVLIEPGRVSVRSTLQPDQIVRFTTDEWTAFIHGAKEGQFDAQ